MCGWFAKGVSCAAVPHGFVVKQQNHIKHWPIFTTYALCIRHHSRNAHSKTKAYLYNIFQHPSIHFSTFSTYPLPALLRPSPWSFLLALFAGLQWPSRPPLLFPYGSVLVTHDTRWRYSDDTFEIHWNINLKRKNELKTSNFMPHFRNKILPSLKLTYHLKLDLWKRRFLLETTIFRCYV